MTTSQSPVNQLKKQAERIAKLMKQGIRGELPNFPVDKDPVKFGIIQDDKTITIEIPRATVISSTEYALSEMILREMRGKRADA